MPTKNKDCRELSIKAISGIIAVIGVLQPLMNSVHFAGEFFYPEDFRDKSTGDFDKYFLPTIKGEYAKSTSAQVWDIPATLLIVIGTVVMNYSINYLSLKNVHENTIPKCKSPAEKNPINNEAIIRETDGDDTVETNSFFSQKDSSEPDQLIPKENIENPPYLIPLSIQNAHCATSAIFATFYFFASFQLSIHALAAAEDLITPLGLYGLVAINGYASAASRFFGTKKYLEEELPIHSKTYVALIDLTMQFIYFCNSIPSFCPKAQDNSSTQKQRLLTGTKTDYLCQLLQIRQDWETYQYMIPYSARAAIAKQLDGKNVITPQEAIDALIAFYNALSTARKEKPRTFNIFDITHNATKAVLRSFAALAMLIFFPLLEKGFSHISENHFFTYPCAAIGTSATYCLYDYMMPAVFLATANYCLSSQNQHPHPIPKDTNTFDTPEDQQKKHSLACTYTAIFGIFLLAIGSGWNFADTGYDEAKEDPNFYRIRYLMVIIGFSASCFINLKAYCQQRTYDSQSEALSKLPEFLEKCARFAKYHTEPNDDFFNISAAADIETSGHTTHEARSDTEHHTMEKNEDIFSAQQLQDFWAAQGKGVTASPATIFSRGTALNPVVINMVATAGGD